MNEKYLPIGSVVLLKNGKKRIMITGFIVSGDGETVYDYSGCIYPEGVISSTETLAFNHDQIDKVFFVGLIDDEEKEFKEKLKQAVN